jgi:peroxiredoxin
MAIRAKAGTPLADVRVREIDGREVRLGDLIERPTVLVVPRYYGCLPCRDYLAQVSRRYDEIEAAGGAAIGVSVGTTHQARWLSEERGIDFPLLVDAERHLYDALDLPKKWWVALNPRGWVSYGRAITHGERQGKVIEPNQLPGLAVLDADANAELIYRGRALGDYPPLDQVLAELATMVAAPTAA